MVGIGQSEAQQGGFVVIMVNRLTAAPVQPPVLLHPGPPTGATPLPLYALDADKRVLHQLWAHMCGGEVCEVCVMPVAIDSGKNGECVVLSSDYAYLAMYERVVAMPA